MKRQIMTAFLLAAMILALTGCGAPVDTDTPDPSEPAETPAPTPAPAQTPAPTPAPTPTPTPTPTPEPEYASMPMPGEAEKIVLQDDELLFTGMPEYPQAEESLFAFVLSADKMSVTSLTYEIINAELTYIINGKPSDTVIIERISSTSTPGSVVFDVIGGVLTINTDTYDIVLTFDGETAGGTINFHYNDEGFSFESMSDLLIEGFDYPDDIPPSTADYGEVPVTFRVAKRG